jgi:Ni,Fe-hydrogenase I large subunit
VAIEGELHVALRCRGGRTESVAVRSTRPFVAPHLLKGRGMVEACRLVATLFSVCGRSQAIAAAAACEAASGRAAPIALRTARQRLVAVEVMQEGFFQALTEWPRTWHFVAAADDSMRSQAELRRTLAAAADGLAAALEPGAEAPDATSVGAMDEAVRRAVAPVAQATFGVAAEAWLARRRAAGFEAWLAEGATPTARALHAADALGAFGASELAMLPRADEAMLAELVQAMDDDPRFERAPLWRGVPAETGAMARADAAPCAAIAGASGKRSALARCLARLAELASLAAGESTGDCGGMQVDAGEGVGWVETARGLLVHRARVDESGRIESYRIVAPTEWNFHPDGALARGLDSSAFADAGAAERGVRWLLQSLDPCVGARVEVAYA